jgi:hypothetical protein
MNTPRPVLEVLIFIFKALIIYTNFYIWIFNK